MVQLDLSEKGATMKRSSATMLAALGLAAALALAACGEGGEETAGEGQHVDGAFIAEMIPHHRMAVQMAQLAQRRAERPQIVSFAAGVIDAQAAEIREMEAIHRRLFGTPPPSDGHMAHGGLGLTPEMAGMDMDMGALASADDFDRAFIEAMVPHHRGATLMSQIELNDGEDEELQGIAEDIVDAQSAEIARMQEWHRRWYGSAVGEATPQGEQHGGEGHGPGH
jgi:uncharacterized protein (DUF305 family)